MKNRDIKNLTEKYEAGESTLEEERFLFEQLEESNLPLEAWAIYAKKQKQKAPKNLNEKLWKSFEIKQARKKRFRIGMLSAAASILLLIATIFITSDQQNELSYSEKEALLEESIAMFGTSEQETIPQEVIYENDLIIIYASNK